MHLELLEVARQQFFTLDDESRGIVSDNWLLPVTKRDLELRILAQATCQQPDPGAQLCSTHSAGQILRQRVYLILDGSSDGNEGQLLRQETLVGVGSRLDERPLAAAPLSIGSSMPQLSHKSASQSPISERCRKIPLSICPARRVVCN